MVRKTHLGCLCGALSHLKTKFIIVSTADSGPANNEMHWSCFIFFLTSWVLLQFLFKGSGKLRGTGMSSLGLPHLYQGHSLVLCPGVVQEFFPLTHHFREGSPPCRGWRMSTKLTRCILVLLRMRWRSLRPLKKYN